MAPRKWDAYKCLNITTRDSHNTTCVGSTRYGKRCRWDIDRTSYDKIIETLDAMEGRPPMEAIDLLEELAELSLCSEYHQNQVDDVVDEWESAIMEAAKEYEKRMGLKGEIKALKEDLGKEEAKTEKLQRKVEELQARVKNQARHREHQAEIEKLRAQLAAEKDALKFVKRKCEENSAASSLLAGELTVKSTEYQRNLSQKSEAIERTTAEQNNLRAKVATLETQFSRLEKQSIQKGQELDRATTKQMDLSRQVESLTRELDSQSKTSSNYQSDLLSTQTHRDTLSKEVEDLQSQLDIERQRSSELVLGLEQASIAHTTLSNEKIAVQAQLESELQKYDELSAELSQLKTDQATLSIEAEALQIKLASEHKTSALRYQELSAAKEDLITTKLALGEAQASLEICQRGNDELKALAAERRKEDSALISTLTDQIDFFKSHPLKAFFMSVIDAFKRLIEAIIKRIGSVRSSKRIHGANDPES